MRNGNKFVRVWKRLGKGLKRMRRKRLLVCASIFCLWMRPLYAMDMTEPATLSLREKSGSEELLKIGSVPPEQVSSLVSDLLEIAEDEVERTAEEAVKAVVAALGSELAASEARSDGYYSLASRLELENKALKKECAALKKVRLGKSCIWCGAGFLTGAAATSLLIALLK